MLNTISGYPIPFDVVTFEQQPRAPYAKASFDTNPSSGPISAALGNACSIQVTTLKECHITKYSAEVNAGRGDPTVVETIDFTYRVPSSAAVSV